LAKAGRKDNFCTHWLSLPLKLHLTDQTPERPAVTIELRTGDEPMTIETAEGTIRTRLGSAQHPDAVLTGIPQLILGVLAGRLDLAEARAAGLKYDGDPAILRRVQRNRARPAQHPESTHQRRK
jgi:hypothetical protein